MKTTQSQHKRVYFLGSGKIGIPVLDVLSKSSRICLIGAGTHVDRPAGRKRKMHATPVGEWATTNSVNIDKIECVNQPDFLTYLRTLSPDIILVASFGQLLKQPILDLPATCCLNLHASLLPAYRGASPIPAAILNGDEKTGITFMEMEKGLDTGPIFCYYDYSIPAKITAEELEDQLGSLAATHIEDVIEAIVDGELTASVQDHAKASYAGKIHKKEGEIDWAKPAVEIERMIRAYQPWPVAFFNFHFNRKVIHIKVLDAKVVDSPEEAPPGVTVEAEKHSWVIACGKRALKLKRLIPQGRNEMTGEDFIHGHKVTKGMSIY